MLRKTIFIGQTKGNTVYLNTETNQILKKKSNSILKMKRSRYTTIGIFAISPFLGLLAFILEKIIVTGTVIYTKPILVCLALIWIIENIGLIFLLEIVLYGKKSNHLVPASTSEFGQAYRSNIIFNNPKGGKITIKNKILTTIATVLVVACSIVQLIFMILSISPIFSNRIVNFLPKELILLYKQVDFKVLLQLILLGFIPFVGYLVLFQNNPLRWLLAVEKYKKKIESEKVK